MGELIATYFIVSLIIYFLPTITAMLVGCDRKGSVFIMNLFLGWTFIGWVWAFIWSVSSNHEQQNIVINNHIPADKIINPIEIQPIQNKFKSYGNTQTLTEQKPQLENVDLKIHLDKISQLKQMKQLLDDGVLTNKEFNEQKSKILEVQFMEKNIYEILHEWHELLKSGVITNEEFAAKKNELLGEEKKISPKIEIDIPFAEADIQSYEANEDLFIKPKWYKRSKYWIGLLVFCLASIIAWNVMSRQKDLTQDTIISDLKDYCIKKFEKDKNTKGTLLYEDRKYIDSFSIKISKGDYGETLVDFYPKYSRYPNIWLSESSNILGQNKLEQCISSYTFKFDTTHLNDDNRYIESKISKLDINKDGKFDYLVDGFFQDCSGGSGSEGKYFLTFINNGKKLELTDVLITLPLEYTINGTRLILKGKYKSWFKESVYNFDQEKNKWEYSASESSSYSSEE